MKKREMLTFSEFVIANRASEALAELTVQLNKERIKSVFYRKLKCVRQRSFSSEGKQDQ